MYLKKWLIFFLLISSGIVKSQECDLKKIEGLSEDNVIERFKELKTDARNCIPVLIDRLRIVSNTNSIIPRQALERESDIHVIWLIRALRYLTGKIMAVDQFSISMLEEQKYFISTLDNKYKFFGTKMSSDVIYIAPVEVQSAVIHKWKYWTEKCLENHVLPVSVDINEWYF